MHISLAAEPLFSLGPLIVTNSLLTSWIVVVLLMLVGLLVGLRFQKLPGNLQQILEIVYETIEDLATSVAGEKGKNYTPFALTLFLYILLSNWLGLIPGVGSIGINVTEHGEQIFVPFIRSATADLNSTVALALLSVVVSQVLGLRASGLIGHLRHFKNPLEIVAELAKILSFSFRLFGNVFAGEVLLLAGASILVLVTGTRQLWFGVAGGIIQLPFLGLELLVGFIQAFIFASLTLVFIGLYTQSHKNAH